MYMNMKSDAIIPKRWTLFKQSNQEFQTSMIKSVSHMYMNMKSDLSVHCHLIYLKRN